MRSTSSTSSSATNTPSGNRRGLLASGSRGPQHKARTRLDQDLDHVTVPDAVLAPDALALKPRGRPPDPGAHERLAELMVDGVRDVRDRRPFLERKRFGIGRAARAEAHSEEAR